jgi:hypothetical protein
VKASLQKLEVRMNTYRGIGPSLAFAGAILTSLTYFFLGIMPLVALWIDILLLLF